MNKSELTQTIMTRCKLSKVDAQQIMKIFFDGISQALIDGERVEIRGLFSFYNKEYAGYTGRNPKTGKKVQVPAKKLPFFKPGKDLKERVDY
ncbi:MAG: integration host factor subunit beta [Desulfobacter sp.]|nr:MAG: integration host factor subunit beta [Desulfobacter sp.]